MIRSALFCAAALCASAAAQEPVAPMDAAGSAIEYVRCLDEADVTVLSAHRGGAEPGYPENAIETFERSLAIGPMLIETDIRQSADGVFVLMHDETLERTTTGEGPVAGMDWAELRTLRLVDNDGAETAFRVPSLAQALEWAEGRAILQLDVKRGVDPAEIARFVARSGARDRAAVIVYSLEDAVAVAEADPSVSISVGIEDAAAFDALIEAGVPAQRLMAWTGVLEGPKTELWALLDAQGVPAAGGSLWVLDGQVQETGDTSIYRALAASGLDVLSSDYHRLAYEALSSSQDAPAAARACTTALGGTD